MNSAIEIANSSLPNLQEKGIMIQLLGQLITNAWLVGGLFFGLWLMPMGFIVISSGRMPNWLGRILFIGGIGYILQTIVICAGVQSPYSDISCYTCDSWGILDDWLFVNLWDNDLLSIMRNMNLNNVSRCTGYNMGLAKVGL
jgi:hypothetical protein